MIKRRQAHKVQLWQTYIHRDFSNQTHLSRACFAHPLLAKAVRCLLYKNSQFCICTSEMTVGLGATPECYFQNC